MLSSRKTGRVQVLTPNEEKVERLRGGPSLGNVAIQPDPDGVVRSATIHGDKFPGHFFHQYSVCPARS